MSVFRNSLPKAHAVKSSSYMEHFSRFFIGRTKCSERTFMAHSARAFSHIIVDLECKIFCQIGSLREKWSDFLIVFP